MAATQRLSRAEQRERTRQRLIDAAEYVFASRGIGAASIEEIAEHAGYTRGAFYSNFDSKDDVVHAVLERRATTSAAELQALVEASTSPDDFFELMRARELDQEASAIVLELALYAMRNPDARPRLAEVMKTSRAATTHVVRHLWAQFDVDVPADPEFIGKILQALDDGMSLLRLIEPDAYPFGLYTDAVSILQEAGLALARERSS